MPLAREFHCPWFVADFYSRKRQYAQAIPYYEQSANLGRWNRTLGLLLLTNSSIYHLDLSSNKFGEMGMDHLVQSR